MRFRNIWKCVFVGRTASYTSLHSCRGSCRRCIAICASMLQCIHCDASLSVYSSAALKRLSVSIRTDASIEDRSIHPIHSQQRRPAAVDHWTPPYTFYPFYPSLSLSLSLSLCMCVCVWYECQTPTGFTSVAGCPTVIDCFILINIITDKRIISWKLSRPYTKLTANSELDTEQSDTFSGCLPAT